MPWWHLAIKSANLEIRCLESGELIRVCKWHEGVFVSEPFIFRQTLWFFKLSFYLPSTNILENHITSIMFSRVFSLIIFPFSLICDTQALFLLLPSVVHIHQTNISPFESGDVTGHLQWILFFRPYRNTLDSGARQWLNTDRRRPLVCPLWTLPPWISVEQTRSLEWM